MSSEKYQYLDPQKFNEPVEDFGTIIQGVLDFEGHLQRGENLNYNSCGFLRVHGFLQRERVPTCNDISAFDITDVYQIIDEIHRLLVEKGLFNLIYGSKRDKKADLLTMRAFLKMFYKDLYAGKQIGYAGFKESYIDEVLKEFEIGVSLTVAELMRVRSEVLALIDEEKLSEKKDYNDDQSDWEELYELDKNQPHVDRVRNETREAEAN